MTYLAKSGLAVSAEAFRVADLVVSRWASTPYLLEHPDRILFLCITGVVAASVSRLLVVCEMHQEERKCIFTCSLSSQAKCLPFN